MRYDRLKTRWYLDIFTSQQGTDLRRLYIRSAAFPSIKDLFLSFSSYYRLRVQYGPSSGTLCVRPL